MRHQKSPNEYAGTLKGADLRASGRGAPPCPASIAWMAASLAASPTALIREVGGRSTARPTRSTRPAVVSTCRSGAALRRELWTEEPLLVALPRDHRLVRRRRLFWRDLSERRCWRCRSRTACRGRLASCAAVMACGWRRRFRWSSSPRCWRWLPLVRGSRWSQPLRGAAKAGPVRLPPPGRRGCDARDQRGAQPGPLSEQGLCGIR